MANVMVSIPCIDGRVETRTMLAIEKYLTTDNTHKYFLEFMLNDSLITHARNSHFGTFYNNPEFDYLLTIDSDIIINKLNDHEGVLDRLISRKKDYIGAIYAKKMFNEQGYLVSAGTPINDDEQPILDGRIVQMNAMPTGFMLMSRECADQMVKGYPELYYEEDSLSCMWSWAVYNTMVIKDARGVPRSKSEDYSFCERWKALGGEIWCDTSIKLTHVGNFNYTLQ